MNAKALLEDLRRRNVSLAVHNGNLQVDAPAGTITEEIRAALVDHKRGLIKLLTWEERKLEKANRLGCVSRWSKYPTWIELHDPTTGEWHEVRASECLPGVVAEADRQREQGGVA